MTTEEVLRELERRGFKVELKDGKPALVGDRQKATTALLAVLRWHREAIAERLRPSEQTVVLDSEPAPEASVGDPEPVSRETQAGAREFLWRDGHHYVETPDNEWLWGRADRWPVGAWWWKAESTSWTPTEDASHVAGIDSVTLSEMQAEAERKRLARSLSCTPGPDAEPGHLDGEAGAADSPLLGEEGELPAGGDPFGSWIDDERFVSA